MEIAETVELIFLLPNLPIFYPQCQSNDPLNWHFNLMLRYFTLEKRTSELTTSSGFIFVKCYLFLPWNWRIYTVDRRTHPREWIPLSGEIISTDRLALSLSIDSIETGFKVNNKKNRGKRTRNYFFTTQSTLSCLSIFLFQTKVKRWPIRYRHLC